MTQNYWNFIHDLQRKQNDKNITNNEPTQDTNERHI